jgi:bifunctional UDP-N-acetylglucosamine pyrophosphorylase/glucosamine-1-phosphate N-acetyltransferase
MKTTAVILAAGKGTRMKSNLHKVLHPILGKTMIQHVINSVAPAISEKPIVVVGQDAESVMAAVEGQAHFALQAEQLGTGHAVLSAKQSVTEDTDIVLVSFADMPLFRTETYAKLIELQQNNSGPITMATVIAQDPRGFGRIVRNEQNEVVAIVEEAVATPEQLLIKELNISAYCFDANWLWDALTKIKKSPKGEYYLTDVVEIAVNQGEKIQAIVLEDNDEAIGVNNRIHLSEAQATLQKRINQEWMLAGVTIIDPRTTYIETDVQIGIDTVIHPNTILKSGTTIGENCQIGPDTYIIGSEIGNHTKIFKSVLEFAKVGNHVDMGPFGHLRKNAHLDDHVHMGNFGEVKDSYLAPGVKMGHFSYIGNATIHENVNIGCGTITCNYDGKKKHPTVVGKNAFIGSGSMLVSPVEIGENATTGAGSVVTKDVPPNVIVAGTPAKLLKKKDKDKQ